MHYRMTLELECWNCPLPFPLAKHNAECRPAECSANSDISLLEYYQTSGAAQVPKRACRMISTKSPELQWVIVFGCFFLFVFFLRAKEQKQRLGKHPEKKSKFGHWPQWFLHFCHTESRSSSAIMQSETTASLGRY